MDNPPRPLFQWCPPQVEEKALRKEHGVALPSVNRRHQDGSGQTAMMLDQTLDSSSPYQWMINGMNEESIRLTEMAQSNDQARKSPAARIGIDKDGCIGQIDSLCDVKVVLA